MSPAVVQWIITLGVPGLALYVFYLLLNRFGFETEKIGPTWAAIIALVFLFVVGGITYHAIERFAPPLDGKPPQVSHQGELRNLVRILSIDAQAKVHVNLSGTADEKRNLGRLFVDKTAAPTYSELVSKICGAHEGCLECNDEEVEGAHVFGVSLVSKIDKSCDHEGEKVFCCVPD